MSGIDTFLGNINVDATISIHSITISYMFHESLKICKLDENVWLLIHKNKGQAPVLTMICLLRFKVNATDNV